MFPSFHASVRLDFLGNLLRWNAILVYSCRGIFAAYFSNLMKAAALTRVFDVRAASATTRKSFYRKLIPLTARA